MKDWVREVRSDTFGIVDRLKAIDEGYFVVYDKKSHGYEVHNRFQRGNTFALKVPYPSLDARTVTLVRRTRAENAKKLLDEIERENKKREERADKAIIEKAMAEAEELL